MTALTVSQPGDRAGMCRDLQLVSSRELEYQVLYLLPQKPLHPCTPPQSPLFTPPLSPHIPALLTYFLSRLPPTHPLCHL